MIYINAIHLCLMAGHKVACVTTFVRSLRTCIVFVFPFHLVTVNHKHRLLSTCWLLHCTVQSVVVTFALNFNPTTWLEARLSLVFYHVMWSVVSCNHRSIRLLWNHYYVCSSVRYYFDIVRYYVWWNHVPKNAQNPYCSCADGWNCVFQVAETLFDVCELRVWKHSVIAACANIWITVWSHVRILQLVVTSFLRVSYYL